MTGRRIFLWLVIAFSAVSTAGIVIAMAHAARDPNHYPSTTEWPTDTNIPASAAFNSTKGHDHG